MPVVLFDTNIFIDAMLGYAVAEKVLGDYSRSAISFVTYIEMMAGAKSASEVVRVAAMLSHVKILQSTPEIMRRAADIRNGSVLGMKKVAASDAIIAATAQVTRRTLITRNTKDFSGSWVFVPYELEQHVKVVRIRPPLQ
jgi:predicted nucleic acid-binding protein